MTLRRLLLLVAVVTLGVPASAAAKRVHAFRLTIKMTNSGTWTSHSEQPICPDRRMLWDGTGSYRVTTRPRSIAVRMTDTARPRFIFRTSDGAVAPWPGAGWVEPFSYPVTSVRSAMYTVTGQGPGALCRPGIVDTSAPDTASCGTRRGTAVLILHAWGSGLRLAAPDMGPVKGECPAESPWATSLPKKQPGTAGAIRKLRNRRIRTVVVKVRSTSTGRKPVGIGEEAVRGRQTGKLAYTLIFRRQNRAKD